MRWSRTNLLEILELLISGQSFLLGHAAVDGDGREVLLGQELGQSHAALNGLDEDHHLKRNNVIELGISVFKYWHTLDDRTRY